MHLYHPTIPTSFLDAEIAQVVDIFFKEDNDLFMSMA